LTRRLVESIKNDPFIDVAFVSYLVSHKDWFKVVQRQARIYSEIGDIGEGTVTFRMYRDRVKRFIISTFKRVYERGLEEYIEKIGDEKARRAWRAVITLLVSQWLMDRARVGLGELLPAEYAKLEDAVLVLNTLIEEKTKRKGLSATVAVKSVLEKLDAGRVANLAPLLWWINLVIESEVFEGILKYHYIASNRSLIADFVKSVEEKLSEVEGHVLDYNYMEQEVLKGLLSRCTELRGQYINKLQNAIIFIKLWRRSVKNPQAWGWFLEGDVLTYAMSVYLTEVQSLIGLERKILDVSALLSPKHGVHSGPASALSTLILMSPIFMQYVIEARGDVAVTPADIIVAIARIIRSRGVAEDLGVDMRAVAEEIVKFWDEKGLSQRLRRYVRDEITPEVLFHKDTLTISLSLIISTGIEGVLIFTRRKPELLLPPRMMGFDSLYIRPEPFLSTLKSIWV